MMTTSIGKPLISINRFLIPNNQQGNRGKTSHWNHPGSALQYLLAKKTLTEDPPEIALIQRHDYERICTRIIQV
jgi:hypothetical protein